MKLSQRSTPVLLPLLGLALTFSALLSACSDSKCSDGSVRMNITLPPSVTADAVELTFEVAGQLVHSQRLPVAAGASTVSADIRLPNGYPAEKSVIVTAVAKSADVPMASWFTSQVFPPGCIGFVITLFAPNTKDAGTFDGSVPADGSLGDAAPDSSNRDGASLADGGGNDVGPVDANEDTPAM